MRIGAILNKTVFCFICAGSLAWEKRKGSLALFNFLFLQPLETPIFILVTQVIFSSRKMYPICYGVDPIDSFMSWWGIFKLRNRPNVTRMGKFENGPISHRKRNILCFLNAWTQNCSAQSRYLSLSPRCIEWLFLWQWLRNRQLDKQKLESVCVSTLNLTDVLQQIIFIMQIYVL